MIHRLKNRISSLKSRPEQRAAALKKLPGRAWSVFRGALLIGLSYVLLYPLLFMISTSIRSVEDTYDITVKWIPKNFTFENIRRVWQLLEYPGALLRTLVVAVGSTLLLLAVCSLTAYGLARFKFRGRGVIFGLVVLTVIVPAPFFVLSSYLNFRFFGGFGLLDLINLIAGTDYHINLLGSYLTFILPAAFGIGIKSGLYIYIFRQFFKGLPKELEEAAYIDGCGHLKTFVRIMVPNAVQAYVSVFLFSFVWHWNDYQLAGLFLENKKTLSVLLSMLSNLISSDSVIAGQAVPVNQLLIELKTGCLLVVAPLVIFYLVFQRFFTESVERTGLVE